MSNRNCKYTLRNHMNTIDLFISFLKTYKGIGFYEFTIISNNLNRRICRIKEYLSIDYDKPKKISIDDIIRNTTRFMDRE